MARILLCFERFANVRDTEGTHAMLHQNSVFHGLLKQLPWHRFEQIVEKYSADDLSRRLSTKRHFIALLFGQLSGCTSLRDIVTGMASHETRLYHLGAAPVKRSTLSDANAVRSWQVFGDVFTALLSQAHRGLRRASADVVRLIDSTGVRLSSLSRDWATFSADMVGVKAHIIYDPHMDHPVYFAVTPANVNDITAAKAMPIEGRRDLCLRPRLLRLWLVGGARRCRLPVRDTAEEEHAADRGA